MRLFTCTDHKGHWPVGTASVIVAHSAAAAREMLAKELTARGLGGGDFTLNELSLDHPAAVVLCDGDY